MAPSVHEDLFPVGIPAGPEHVVDREEFIDQLVTRLLDRNSVALAAPRRVGKTSVAQEVLRRLRENEGACTVAIDLTTTPTPRELAERLTAGCLAALSPAARAATGVWQGLGRLARIPGVRATMHDLELQVALREDRERSPEDLLTEALHLPEHTAVRIKRRCVVLFDEFQAAVGIGGQELLGRMRGTFQLQRHTAFLFLGSQSGIMRDLFGARHQPFFRFASVLDVPPVPDGAWRSYIRGRFATRGIAIDDAAIDVMLEYTGGHAWDTMKTAYEAFLLGRRSRIIDGRTATAACADTLAQLGPVFDAEIDAMGPRALAVLGRIARGEPLYAGERSTAGIQRTLKVLQVAGVIRHVAHGRYEFVEGMLRRHLAR